MAQISGEKLLIAGGYKLKKGKSEKTKSTFILDLKTNNASETGSLRDKDSMHSCVTFKKKVYGVTRGGGTLFFDPKTEEWAHGPSFGHKLKHCGSLVVLRDNLFYFNSDRIYKLSDDKKTWIHQAQNSKLLQYGLVIVDSNPKDHNMCNFATVY